jgi:hypothetical protein
MESQKNTPFPKEDFINTYAELRLSTSWSQQDSRAESHTRGGICFCNMKSSLLPIMPAHIEMVMNRNQPHVDLYLKLLSSGS